MSIERHSRTRQIELGKSLGEPKKIYLDTRYWIIVRDTALGVRGEAAATDLLHHLRRGVAGGRLVCPVSASTFFELMKQPYTPTRRLGTAEIIDELSLGITMIQPHMVMGTEVCSFLLRALGSNLHSMQELIWTKVAYVLGDLYPSLTQLSPDDELFIQKAFFDELWAQSLSDMVRNIGENCSRMDPFGELSRQTNEKNAQHKDELRSFAQAYDAELRGIIEVLGPVAADVMHQQAEKAAEQQLSATDEERAQAVNMCRNLLYFACKNDETKLALRSLHIGASIHAAMRWDKGRQFKPNDYYDFEHAVAALGYCDAFFTERPLCDLVTRPHLQLQALNDCRVFSDIQAAADHIAQLATG